MGWKMGTENASVSLGIKDIEIEHKSCLKKHKSPCHDESPLLAFPKIYSAEQ